MNYYMERSAVSPTVDELLFLDSSGFKFTAYVDHLDPCASGEALRAFLDCLPPTTEPTGLQKPNPPAYVEAMKAGEEIPA